MVSPVLLPVGESDTICRPVVGLFRTDVSLRLLRMDFRFEESGRKFWGRVNRRLWSCFTRLVVDLRTVGGHQSL